MLLQIQNFKIVVPKGYDWSRFLEEKYLSNLFQNQLPSTDISIWKLETSKNIDRHLVYAVPSRDGQLFVNNKINLHNGMPIYHLGREGLLYSISTYHVDKSLCLRTENE